ncbi:hypothetical protein RSP799_07640 [Ralstonia solanacearum]|nr:hypothetical protein RSP799_07640 [Ralstonia solanacearum]
MALWASKYALNRRASLTARNLCGAGRLRFFVRVRHILGGVSVELFLGLQFLAWLCPRLTARNIQCYRDGLP